MSSNIGVTKALLGRYGLFQPGVLGNNNVNAAGVQIPMFIGTTTIPSTNVIPANLSSLSNGTPGSSVSNGNYQGQGIVSTFDSGPLFFQQCSGWAKWGVMARSDIPGNPVNGLSATVYGTWDWDTASGALTTYSATTGLRTGGNENWFQIPTPSVESSGDTATWVNPITGYGQGFWTNAHVLAIRINVTALVSGSVLFSIWATP